MQQLMESMQHRIDEGENIMNICKYHIYYVIGPSRLLTVQLCKRLMPLLPVRVQSQDPRLLYTSLIHGYHVTHLLEWGFPRGLTVERGRFGVRFVPAELRAGFEGGVDSKRAGVDLHAVQ